MPCKGTVAYKPPTFDLIVAGQVGATYVNQWILASKLLATDKVYTDTPNPADTSSNWWMVSSVPFKAPTPGPPPPPIVMKGAIVTLSWVAPTTNTDGSLLTDLSGFDIYQGPSATTLMKVAALPRTATSWQSAPQPPGTYFFCVTDFNTGLTESAKSNIVSATITQPAPTPKVPGAPISVSISVTVTAIAP